MGRHLSSTGGRGVLRALVSTVLLVTAFMVSAPYPALAVNEFTPASEATSPIIIAENRRTAADGVSGDWFFPWAERAANREIEGYASATSVNRGESISLFVNSEDSRAFPKYTVDVFRMGYYGNVGGRRILPAQTLNTRRQAVCPTDTTVNMVHCRWQSAVSLAIPASAVSGFYLVKLTALPRSRNGAKKYAYIPFVVRDDARPAKIMMQSSFTTYQAYNHFGGYSFYSGSPAARKVSFNRPYHPDWGMGAGQFFSWEFYAIRFLERNGYDVVYSTNLDTHKNDGRLNGFKAFLSVGHDEYWSKQMYDAVQGARDAGTNMAFLGSNTAYWHVRLENNNREMVGFRYQAEQEVPPAGSQKTILWRDLGRPEARLVGIQYVKDPVDGAYTITSGGTRNCPDWICDAASGLIDGLDVPGLWGYEADMAFQGVSPANLQIVAKSAPFDSDRDGDIDANDAHFDVDFDGKIDADDARGVMTYYDHGNGAGVFASGSNQFVWGLDNFWQGVSARPEIQNLLHNLLKRYVTKP